MREIILHRGEVAFVDEEDYEQVSKYHWCFTDSGNGCRYPKAFIGKEGRYYYMHRMIIRPATGRIVDHIDGNTLNNRRNNLRECSRGENNRNKKRTRSDKKYGKYRGTIFDKRRGMWMARVNINQEKKFCFSGRFKTEEEAARAYDDLAKRYYGVYASMNFPV